MEKPDFKAYFVKIIILNIFNINVPEKGFQLYEAFYIIVFFYA